MNVHETAILNHGPKIGKGTSIGEFCVIQNYDRSNQGYNGLVEIGKHCDIAARVSINCSDSHLRCIGLDDKIEYLPITIEDNVYIGEGAIILGGCQIGHHSVIGAGVILRKKTIIEPYSLVIGNPFTIKHRYYYGRISNRQRELSSETA